jgi:quinoprotein glucose dehydrogenase
MIFYLSRLKLRFPFIIFTLLLFASCKKEDFNWPEYNGGADRNHYSPLTQINAENLNKLTKVWEYRSGGVDSVNNRSQIQCNPIVVDGILYGVSAGSQAFALDASTGKEIWKTNFTEKIRTMTSRGVTYYENKEGKRIFFGFGPWLYALDANTGLPISTFGVNGRINLVDGLWRPGSDDYVSYNTPGVIFKNLLITGQRVSEGPTAALGDIRAYNADTGQLVWTFRTIPNAGEPGSETWPENARQNNGGANSWMGMALDRDNEIVYAPTGSAAFDFYGGDRHGSNLYANCIIALDANTGQRKWHFQIVHHDIWDRDIPAPPNLFEFQNDEGKFVPALAQVTKQGHVFVFNRLTGEPLFPIEEQPVQGTDISGEQPHPTQPIPLKPKPFTRQSFTANDLNPDVADRDIILKELENSRTGSPYIPITRQRTIIFPGTDGGAQWGGAAIDKEGIMYVPAKEIPVYTTLVDAPKAELVTTRKKLYEFNCAPCHRADMSGDHSGLYPSLLNVAERLTKPQVLEVLERGRGMMPPFDFLSDVERNAIISFVMQRTDSTVEISAGRATTRSPYVHTGYNRWYDSKGYPVSKPPWGTLTAINLNTGEHNWQIPLGKFPSSKKNEPVTGTDNYGGPLVTESGLVFIAATPDQKFRAFDKTTGSLLWEAALPAAGYASPSTYSVSGRQYIVIACGGGKLRSRSGDRYIAFALAE